MTLNVHNPDQYMASLRTIIAQGRKKIGLLVGAGAPAGMPRADGTYPLIPAVVGLTLQVLTALNPKYGTQIAGLKAELPKDDIETILSRVRALSKVIGKSKVHDMDGLGFEKFGQDICTEIGKIVDARLPRPESAYADLISWITGASRDYPVEIFTTNYDLLFEEAFEAVRAPFFDGFTGGREPFFDPVSVARNDLPARWTRLWKLHGSLGWTRNDCGVRLKYCVASKANGQSASGACSSRSTTSPAFEDTMSQGRNQPMPCTECSLPGKLASVVYSRPFQRKWRWPSRFEYGKSG